MDFTTVLYPFLVFMNLTAGVYVYSRNIVGAINIGLSAGIFLMSILFRMPVV